jgi:predicted ATPase
VAYGSLLQERRRVLHARIVDAIEALYPSRLTEHVERLGHHALHEERWEKAAAYLRQAGAKAVERTAHREAVTFLEQALKAVDQLAEGVDKLRYAVDLRIDLRNSPYTWGDFERTFPYLREAQTLAADLGDEERSCRVAAYLTHYFWVTADHDRAVETGEKTLVTTRQSELSDLELVSRYYLGIAYHGKGQYSRASDLLHAAAVASIEMVTAVAPRPWRV